jgi:hypothetical protein
VERWSQILSSLSVLPFLPSSRLLFFFFVSFHLFFLSVTFLFTRRPIYCSHYLIYCRCKSNHTADIRLHRIIKLLTK